MLEIKQNSFTVSEELLKRHESLHILKKGI